MTSGRHHSLAWIAVVIAMTVLFAGCSDGADTSSAPIPSPTTTATAPSAAAIKAAPASLTLSCTPAGTSASTQLVATSPRGVKVLAANSTDQPRLIGYRIEPAGGGAAVVGSIQPSVTEPAQAQLYALPPGRMEVRCGRSANTGIDDEVSLSIVDRGGYYSSVSIQKVLGCQPKPLTTERIFPARATRSDALTLMAQRLPAPGRYTVKDGPGYKAADVRQHLVLRDGKGYGIATVALLPNLSYRPAITATC